MTFSNPELLLAEAFVRHTACHIFLTGKAGTGKTTFLHNIQKETAKRLVVTAPTGVAAINAGGVTLHSFFQLPFGPFIPGHDLPAGRHRLRREKINIIRGLDLLVIDEISMVRADLLDGVDSVLRRCRRCEDPFGGVQLLMIGDLHQLAPVVKKDEWPILQPYYESPYFFSSRALGRTELVPIELKHIYRQSDQHFIELLNRVRDNQLDSAALDRINARHIPGFRPKDDEGYITLCTHNYRAEAINTQRLQALAGKSRRFDAVLEGDFPEQAYPTAVALALKTGAQVMFIRNDMSAAKAYFNGKIGTITAISDDSITVRCPGESDPITVTPTTWENIEYTIHPQTAEISRKVIGTFTQYPLKPAWAITIHKSQGLTFDKAIIDAQAAFAFGQVYVALSRCRTFEGIVLSTPITPVVVKTDPAVRRFINELVHHAPTPESLAFAQSCYQQQLLLACFDFERMCRLLDRLARLLSMHAGVIQVAGVDDPAAVQRRATMEIGAVGARFQRQLQEMFSAAKPPAANAAVLHRLTRASTYFGEKFAEILGPGLADAEVETDNKEIRKQFRDVLKQLREEIAVKLAGVLSCRDGFTPERYLQSLAVAAMDAGEVKPRTATPVYTEADVGHPELFENLRDWRRRQAAAEDVPLFRVLHQKTLVQIAISLPDTIDALKQIKGIGSRLAERYGLELIALVSQYRQKHRIDVVTLPQPAAMPPLLPDKPTAAIREDTKSASLALFEQGLTIAQIATQRGLVRSTIEGHLAHFVTIGELAIDKLMPNDTRRLIERQITPLRDKPLREVKEALKDQYSYGEIQLVLAHLKHAEQK